MEGLAPPKATANPSITSRTTARQRASARRTKRVAQAALHARHRQACCDEETADTVLCSGNHEKPGPVKQVC